MPVTKSPLRYPGGKIQLASFVANLINVNHIRMVPPTLTLFLVVQVLLLNYY